MHGAARDDGPGGLLALRWPAQRLGEGLEELARRAGLRLGEASAPIVPASPTARTDTSPLMNRNRSSSASGASHA